MATGERVLDRFASRQPQWMRADELLSRGILCVDRDEQNGGGKLVLQLVIDRLVDPSAEWMATVEPTDGPIHYKFGVGNEIVPSAAAGAVHYDRFSGDRQR